MTDVVLNHLPGILMIAIFLVMMFLMYMRKISALLALPAMAFLFSIVGIVRYGDFWSLLSLLLTPREFLSLQLSAAGFFALLIILAILGKKGILKGFYLFLSAVVALALAGFFNYDALCKILVGGSLGKLFACFELTTILNEIGHKGMLRLSDAYTTALFGGMLAMLVKEKKIAETFIKYAAELAGDRPFFVAFAMMLVTAVLFTALGGLGAIIMVGTIILPIMISLGLPPVVAAGVMLIGVCAGGSFNPANWVLYNKTLNVEVADIQRFSLFVVVLYMITGAIFIFWGTRGRRATNFWAVVDAVAPRKKINPWAMLTPLVPILLIYRLSVFAELAISLQGRFARLDRALDAFAAFANFWDAYIGAWPFIPAFIAGLAYGVLTTWERGNVRILTKAMIEGAESVMPAVLLMLGIGMLLATFSNQAIQDEITPLIAPLIPRTRFAYVVGFSIAAPLALYRGPLNVWGLGFGLAGLLKETTLLPGVLVMGAFISTGAVQGVCDPTNTHNVWIANYLGLDVTRMSLRILPFIWIMVVVALAGSVLLFGF